MTDRTPPPVPSAVTLEPARLALARLDASDGDLPRALARATQIAAEALAVHRVSVWLMLDGGRAIRCEYLHQPNGQDVFAGTILRTSDYPQYFQAIDSRRVVPVSNLEDDPLFQEFRDSYLAPLGITAMLDAPLFQAGSVVGIICHEHLGPSRRWTVAECEFAAAVSDTVSRLFAEAARTSAEQRLGAYHDQLVRLEGLGTVGRLAAGVAHDVRNMTAGVMGAAHLLLHTHGTDPDVAGLARQIEHAAERTGVLTKKLLTLGQDGPRKPRVVDLAAFLRDNARVFQLALRSTVTLSLTPAGPVGRVLVDPVELERVLLNLLVNASDAMPQGGTVLVSVFPSTQVRSSGREGPFVAVEVRDAGVGMNDATIQRMFEPFFTTKGDAGTGLGLAIVRQLVALAGGFLEVDSVEGQGTAVRVFLPAIAGPVPVGA